MIIYVAVMLLLTIFNVVAFRDKKLQRILYVVALFIMFCMTAFRWEVGCDFMTYAQYGREAINSLSYEDALARPEPGYWLTAVSLRDVGLGWEYIDLITALCFFGGLHAMARREPNRLLFITLAFPALVIGLGMSAVRQGLAMGFVCFAFNAFADRKRILYILLLLIAGTFHKSALAFLAMAPFLFPGNIRVKAVIGAVAAIPMVYFMGKTDAAESYANMYLNSGLEAGGGRFRVIPVGLSGLFFWFVLRKDWLEKYKFDYERMLFFSALIIGVLPLVFISSVMGDRFGYYMMPLAFSIQARAYTLFKPVTAFMVFMIPLAHCLLYLVVWISLSTLFWQCYVPYKTWWD